MKGLLLDLREHLLAIVIITLFLVSALTTFGATACEPNPYPRHQGVPATTPVWRAK